MLLCAVESRSRRSRQCPRKAPNRSVPAETARDMGPAAILTAIVPFLRLRSLIASSIDGARASAHGPGSSLATARAVALFLGGVSSISADAREDQRADS